jgi:hypothetical protein
MAALGQTEKNSLRARVLRFAELGYCPTACRMPQKYPKLPRRSQHLTTPAQNCGTGQIRYSFVFVGKAGARLPGMAPIDQPKMGFCDGTPHRRSRT